MLDRKTEIESPAWRHGMIDALTTGNSLAACAGLRGGSLYLALLRRFTRVAPLAYRRYRRAHAQLGNCYRIYPERLSFWQWRTCAVDLAEAVNLSLLLGCSTGGQATQLRRTLLLAPAEPGDAPYRSLRAQGHALDLVPSYGDGLIDGYDFCCWLLYVEGLDGDRYVDAVSEYLFAFWPEDYRRYRYRYVQYARQLRAHAADHHPHDLGPRLDYSAWAAAVCELQEELRRCPCSGSAPGCDGRELRRRLLCPAGEPAPTLDWTLSPKLQAELSC